MANDTNDHLKLPEDSLVEIFFRSSVESVLRAKCVCKQWYNLIQKPQFVLNHLRYQKFHNKGRLLFQYFKDDTQEYKYALFDDETLVNVKYHDIDHFYFPFDQYKLVSLQMEGPIDGLYCLYNREDRIIMWNPALKEFKALPLPHPHFLSHTDLNYHGTIAFGIDPSTRDYKVIVSRNLKDKIGYPLVTHITMYNLTTNTWKLLFGHRHLFEYVAFRQSKNSTFLDGIYYWWTYSGRVIAFDMGEEIFREIMGPDIDNFHPIKGSLTMNHEKVTLLYAKSYSHDIFVMLEEGFWIKQFSITSLPSLNWHVGLWKNNWLLVAMDGYDTPQINDNFQIVLCDIDAEERINVGPKGNPNYFRASIYYESLVSVNSGSKHKSKYTSLSMITNFLESSYNPYLYLYADGSDFFTDEVGWVCWNG